MSQKELIRIHLLRYGSITSWEAIRKYGVTRISAVIFNLKNDGMNIQSVQVKDKNRYGNIVHYVKYTLDNAC